MDANFLDFQKDCNSYLQIYSQVIKGLKNEELAREFFIQTYRRGMFGEGRVLGPEEQKLEIRTILQVQVGVCRKCGQKIAENSCHLDFFLPSNRDGRNILPNKDAICENCFSSKKKEIEIRKEENRQLLKRAEEIKEYNLDPERLKSLRKQLGLDD